MTDLWHILRISENDECPLQQTPNQYEGYLYNAHVYTGCEINFFFLVATWLLNFSEVANSKKVGCHF